MAIEGYAFCSGKAIPVMTITTNEDLSKAPKIDLSTVFEASTAIFSANHKNAVIGQTVTITGINGMLYDDDVDFSDLISLNPFLGTTQAGLFGVKHSAIATPEWINIYGAVAPTQTTTKNYKYAIMGQGVPQETINPIYCAICLVTNVTESGSTVGAYALYADTAPLTISSDGVISGYALMYFFNGTRFINTIDALSAYMTINRTPFVPTTLTCTSSKTLSRGQSSQLEFKVSDDSGNASPVTGVTLETMNDYGDNITIDGQTVTISENCTYKNISLKAKYELGFTLDTIVVLSIVNANTPYSPGGTTSPGQTGGNGSFGKGEVSDNISNNIPSGSAYGEGNSTGMFTRYLMNPAGLSSIGEWLWSTDLGLNIAQTVISKLYGDPAEALISLMSYPFDIVQLTGVTRQQQNIFWGNYDSNVPGIAIKSQAGQFDWGEIELKPYWGSFLDYSPHTKVELYLPWSTGFVELDPNQVLPSNPEAGTVGKIRIKTNVDLNKGSCLHIVSNQDNCVIGCFAGQCGMQVPLFSTDYASKAAGIVMGAAGMAIGATVTAGVNAAAAEAGYEKWHLAHKYPQASKALGSDMPTTVRQGVQMAKADRSTEFNIGSTISDESSRSLALLRTPGHFSRNGGFTDGSAGLGIQYPYIIVSRPQQSVPQGYADHFGFPSNYYGRLGAWGGYTEVGEIHLNGLDATAPELAELEAILKGGIIV